MNDSQNLQKLYQETLEHHQHYLKKVHDAFDRRCDEIEKSANQKLDDVIDEEERAVVLAEQEEALKKTLSELKYAINTSNRDALKKMEEIQNKLDSDALNLEKVLRDV